MHFRKAAQQDIHSVPASPSAPLHPPGVLTCTACTVRRHACTERTPALPSRTGVPVLAARTVAGGARGHACEPRSGDTCTALRSVQCGAVQVSNLLIGGEIDSALAGLAMTLGRGCEQQDFYLILSAMLIRVSLFISLPELKAGL